MQPLEFQNIVHQQRNRHLRLLNKKQFEHGRPVIKHYIVRWLHNHLVPRWRRNLRRNNRLLLHKRIYTGPARIGKQVLGRPKRRPEMTQSKQGPEMSL